MNESGYGTPDQVKSPTANPQGSTPKVPHLFPFGGSQYPWSEFQTERSEFTQSAHDSFMLANAENLISPREKMGLYDGNAPDLESGEILKLDNEEKRRVMEEITTRRKNPFFDRITEICNQNDTGQKTDFITDFNKGFQHKKREFLDAIRELIYKGPYHYVNENIIYWGEYYLGVRSGYGWAY